MPLKFYELFNDRQRRKSLNYFQSNFNKKQKVTEEIDFYLFVDPDRQYSYISFCSDNMYTNLVYETEYV